MKRQTRKLNFISIILSLSFVSCASKETTEHCPSVEEEPISVCRAREKCRDQNSSIGVGVGFGLGNFGMGVGHNTSTGRYESCLDEELANQKRRSQQVAAPAVKAPPASPTEPKIK